MSLFENEIVGKESDPLGGMSLDFFFEGEKVRVVGTWDKPLFVAADVCRVLGLDADSGARTVPEEEKGLHLVQTLGGPQEMTVLHESGLYRLVMRSNKPAAEKFQSWVVREVLPSIRKHGPIAAHVSDKGRVRSHTPQ